MAMQKQFSESRSVASPLWLVGLVLFSILIASVANAWHGYHNTIEQEFRLLEVRALQRAASITGSLENANLMLSNLIDDFSANPTLSKAGTSQLLKDALRQLPQMRSLLVTDASGQVVASNNEQLIGFNASQREYFTVHQAVPLGQAFHISAPFKTTTGVFTTTLSRSLVDGDRRFSGVIVATFDGKFFEKALEFHAQALAVQAALVHKNGVIVGASPKSQMVGKSMLGEPAFLAHLESEQRGSRHTRFSVLEQKKQLVAIQEIGENPLMVIVSRDFDVAIAEWRQSMLIHGAGFLGMTLITLLATAAAWRRQHALEERDRFLKNVTDAVPGMVGYWDQDLRCQFANKTYMEWFGKKPEEIVGHSASALFGETLFEKNGPLMRAALTGEAQHFERALVKADGSTGHTWAHYIPDVRDGGAVAGFYVLVTDVTPLKQAELKLKDSDAFVRSVLDSLPEHVAVIDAEGVITAVNAAWQQFAADNGATDPRRVSVGANYLEVCARACGAPSGLEGAQVRDGIRGVLDGSLPDFTIEYPCHSPDAQRWFVLHGLPLRGSLGGAVMIHQNVTTRHQAEALLRASEEHFRMLAENMADLVWKADAQMRFTYINAADRYLRGFEKDEVLGLPIAEAVTPEGEPLLAELQHRRREAEAAGQKGVSLAVDIPMRRKDGGPIWMEISSTPIYDVVGNTIGFQGMGRDISKRKRQESVLLESQHALQSQLQQTARQKADLEELALHDPLTGLYNRRYLEETLARELSRAKRERTAVAVIMMDLDHFKRVNDTYGHAAGDEVLKALAQLLKSGARDSDALCRYGGEEFVAIMSGMTSAQALVRAESWRLDLQRLVVVYGAFQIRFTMSAGIADFPANADSPEALLARADEMLYRSKHEGRNRITVDRSQA